MGMKKIRIAVIDDELITLQTVTNMLQVAGYSDVDTFDNISAFLDNLNKKKYDLVLLDLNLGDETSDIYIKDILRKNSNTVIVVITVTNSVQLAINCISKGAYDYMVKPCSAERLRNVLKYVEESATTCLKEKVLHYRSHPCFSKYITASESVFNLFEYVESLALTDNPVLIEGETGTGKEIMAGIIHNCSGREGKFLPVNVSGFDENVVNDTLFGHKKGAFTDADTKREGLVKLASGGTLFLDEIGELSEQSQIKLLRFIESKEYFPLGSDHPENSTARLIFATNKDLAEMVDKGTFRKDLYYRIKLHSVKLPPLRERVTDIEPLLDYFVKEACVRSSKDLMDIDPLVYSLMEKYDFPGNIRELKTMAYDIVTREDSSYISMKSIINTDVFLGSFNESKQDFTFGTDDNFENFIIGTFGEIPSLAEFESAYCRFALEYFGSQIDAAKALGVSRQTLARKMKNITK
jgi:DNA-binding NtrC family response regulator